ncbi:complement component C9 [Chanos chanos]|uniref:Complement component C9 n=1 Tax=Chanos chanos TaxID=29144 RepID=A0A6J2USR6_CHACN|nr:complement component C9-like [Chanos chanos]
MRSWAALCVLTCILYQAVPWTEAKSVQGTRRNTRDASDPPAIECKMSAWSDWSPCDPCTKTKYRSRSIETFGQFGARPCMEPIGDREPCVSTANCEEEPKPVCTSSDFKCDSGMCIKKRLVCNVDEDCDDGSDEWDCEKERSPCGNQNLLLSFAASEAGEGINILGSGARMNPFNNNNFNGQCSRVRDPDTLEFERLPWNVGVLHYDSKAEERISKDIYEETHSLIREVTEDSTFKIGVGLSFKFSLPEIPVGGATVSGSVSPGVDFDYEKKNMIKKITEHSTTKSKSFIRVKGQVQVGTYRMRSRGLMLKEVFLDDVKHLPKEYEKGRYFRFMEDYGTHYTMNARTGGEYELVYVMNSEVLKTKAITEKMLSDCLKVGISLGHDITAGVKDIGNFGISGDLSVKPEFCKSVTNKDEVGDEKKPLIEDIITAVRGGTPQSIAAMKSQISKDGILDFTHYVDWAKSLGVKPTIIHSEPEPIYNLIPLDMDGAQERRTNLRRALDDYVAEYSVCKCQPCQNGGTVSLVDGKCVCLCPKEFEGIACQNLRADLIKDRIGTVFQLGNWACWSGWSSCSGGKRTRTRTCNTQGLVGASCKGDTQSEDYC